MIDYEQLRTYARIDGAIVGALWIVSFALFVGEFYNTLLGVLALATSVASLAAMALLSSRYRNNALNGTITFGHAFMHCMMSFGYAALLMAVAQWVYFEFIDNGFIISQYTKMLSSKDYLATMQQVGIDKEALKQAIDTLAGIRPIEIAFQFLTSNIIIGVVASLPIAMITSMMRGRS